MRLIHKSQMGFTLIELMLAIAISGVITGGITMTIFSVVDGSARTNNHMTAVRQVQNAGYWVSHDAQMAQDVVTDDNPETPGVTEFLTLTWTDWESGDVHQVVYTIVDNELQREHYTNGGLSGTTIVAQFIDPDVTKTKCGFAAGAFNLPDHGDIFTITDAVGGDSGTITVSAGSVRVTPTGSATVDGGSGAVNISPAEGAVAWTTPGAGDKVLVHATSSNTTVSWRATTRTATATILTDGDGDVTVAGSGALIFRVTATVGTGSQEASETRVYEIFPRPSI